MKVGLPRFDGHLGVGGVGIKPNHERDHQRATKFCFAGAMAVHGIAIMSGRQGLEFETEIASDTAALNTFVDAMLTTGLADYLSRVGVRGTATYPMAFCEVFPSLRRKN